MAHGTEYPVLMLVSGYIEVTLATEAGRAV